VYDFCVILLLMGLEYLYGFHSVEAALLANLRKCSKLLISENSPKIASIERLAEERGIPVDFVAARRLEQLCKGGKKNQGVLLRCHEKPVPSIECLEPLTLPSKGVGQDEIEDFGDNEMKLKAIQFNPTLRNQVLTDWLDDGDGIEESLEQEEEEEVKDEVVLALDRIQDPQNLGAICRSALFLGVSKVVLSEKKSLTRITPAVSSVSSGAAEFLPIYQSVSFVQFLAESRQNGWTVIGATSSQSSKSMSSTELSNIKGGKILVVGNEGEGLTTNIKNQCDVFTTITSSSLYNPHNVDSLNVGVATGILLHSLKQ